MAKVFKVLSACGSGIATSSHVATSIRQGMADRGVNVEVRTCGVNEMSGLIDNVKPTIIVSKGESMIDELITAIKCLKSDKQLKEKMSNNAVKEAQKYSLKNTYFDLVHFLSKLT